MNIQLGSKTTQNLNMYKGVTFTMVVWYKDGVGYN